MSNQLTLIQGEFIVCDEIAYAPTPAPPTLTATAALPINTMRGTSVRLDDEIVPLPFIRSQERKAVSHRIRIDGPVAARIAKWLGLADPSRPPARPLNAPAAPPAALAASSASPALDL